MDIPALKSPTIDLRQIFQTSATYLSVIGLSLNAFLVYLIFFKTSKKVSDYKIILIQNCFVDVLFTIVSEIAKGQTDYKSGTYYLIGSDLLHNIPYPFDYLFILLWVFLLGCCVTFIPVQFIYRHVLIVHGKTLTTLQYLVTIACAILVSVTFVVLFGFVMWPEKDAYNAAAELLKNDIYYFRGIPVFMVADARHWPLRLCFAYGYFFSSVSYGITIFTCVKVWKKLKESEAVFSAQTRKMHAQMTITMILQAIIPLIFVLIPIGCAFTAALALINVPGLGMIINLMCCWIPVANPLVTIFSIRSYRIYIFSCYHKCLEKVHLKYAIISFQTTTSSFTEHAVSRNVHTLKN